MKGDSNAAHHYIAVDAAMGEFLKNMCDSFLYVLIPVVLAWVVYLWSKGNSPSSHVNVPPGPKGIPIIGQTLRWYFSTSSSHPTSFVEDFARRFGNIFTCNLFGDSTVISVDPKFNRYILQNEGTLFKASNVKSIRDLVGKNSLIVVHGDLHKKLYGMAASQLTREKLKRNFMRDIQIILERTMDNWKDREMLFEVECRKLAVSLMGNQLLGVSNEHEVNELSTHFSDLVDGIVSIPINIPGSAYSKGMKVINETLRLRGIATALFRETTEDVKFNDYVIPKGWRVVPYLHAIHVNEEFYKDALSFNPWRWLEPDAENKNWRNSEVFLPFGAGGRFCAGAELAMLEISLFLYYFVSKYSWDQLKEDRPSYFPMARMVNRFPIHVKERRQ